MITIRCLVSLGLATGLSVGCARHVPAPHTSTSELDIAEPESSVVLLTLPHGSVRLPALAFRYQRVEQVLEAGKPLPPPMRLFFTTIDSSANPGSIRIHGRVTVPDLCYRLGSSLGWKANAEFDVEITLIPPRGREYLCSPTGAVYDYVAELRPVPPGPRGIRVRYHLEPHEGSSGQARDTTALWDTVVVR
jgi:hypothetical protein